jgi:hypothetical protein
MNAILDGTPEEMVEGLSDNDLFEEELFGEVFLEDEKIVFNLTSKQRKQWLEERTGISKLFEWIYCWMEGTTQQRVKINKT